MDTQGTSRERAMRARGSVFGYEVLRRYQAVRAVTEEIAAPLAADDQLLQSMPVCSPTRWHRAHTTWFFETFLLQPSGFEPVDPHYGALFNSYYEAVGPRHPRPKRGMLSRPTVDEIAAYRRAVDERIGELLGRLDENEARQIASALELGLAHEQQHQELILTDILHAFHENPLLPAYRGNVAQGSSEASSPGSGAAPEFQLFAGGVAEIGRSPHDGFSFDNEGPRHKVWLEPFWLATRLVTVGEVKAFMAEGGYGTPSLWLSDGYDMVRAQRIEAPLYARVEGGAYVAFGLDGLREVPDDEPVSHVSYYEADAIARFLGGRLPSEQEWEYAASRREPDGNFLDSGALHPRAAADGDRKPMQLFGDVWEWTRSSYEPYPRYRPAQGALGEYNGKFMVNQRVLRGGSCLTPRGHVRASYRNFWHPDTRFQMAGLRVAKDG